MKKKVVMLSGGLSEERKISFLTGKACALALKKKGYKVITLDAKGFFIDKIKKINPKLVFNALHGKYGEDGFIQSILESLKIPYTHSGVLSSSLAMDKELSRIILRKKISFPVVIKPIDEGSSIGVYICKNHKQLQTNYKKLINKYSRVLVEQYIPGKEIQVAVMGKKALGAIELIPSRTFYDYEAKYSVKAKTKHIMPATISKTKYKEALFLAKKAHQALGCRGVTRSDFRYFKDKFYLLETNTQPGMTKLSLVPEIANYCGLSFEELISWIAKDASINR